MNTYKNSKKLKEEYNNLLKRINKAEKFFKKCTKEELNKHLPLFLELNEKANNVLNKLKKNKIIITLEELERGFENGKA